MTVTTGAAAASSVSTRHLPAAIGRYRIMRLVGEGGMGIVYEAQQEQPRRSVALKVIRAGVANPELLRRFELEAQALGRLQHPGIGQIYEAGTADTGLGPQPYFAMEFISGESLLTYAAAHRLEPRQRLELLAKVCDAIQHAHQRGIIHRDLKPANIQVDGQGQPKVLDFGVARVTDCDAQATRQTDTGQLIGTLAYMSPEQVLADPLEMDTRSDVYALGVILYELLAGRLPYTLGRKLHEAVQTIREEDPARLSSVNRAYRGDIETIAAKALEKEKSRRYASAADLAADIRRFLKDEPIVARPATTPYQLRKFIRRNRALASGLAAVFVVLVFGVVVSTRQAVRARRAERTALQERDRAATAERSATLDRDLAVAAESVAQEQRARAVAEQRRADNEAATAKAVNEFLQDDLLAQASAWQQAGPQTRADPNLTVRTALDRAAARIEKKFTGQPLVEAAIRATIGHAYTDLGLLADAEHQLERALALRRRLLGEENPVTPETADVVLGLASVYKGQAKYDKVESVLADALARWRPTLGEEDSRTLSALDILAEVYRLHGRFELAEPLQTRALTARRRVLGPENPRTLDSMNGLAMLYQAQGKYAKAEPLLTAAADASRRVLGEDHPDTLRTASILGSLYEAEGRYPQAEEILLKVLDTKRRTLGEEHPDTLTTLSGLGWLYQTESKFGRAEEIFTKLLEADRRLFGGDHPSTLAAMNNLALAYQRQGKYALAEPLLNQTIEGYRRSLGAEHPSTLTAMNSLGLVYRNQGKLAQAEPLLAKVVEIRGRVSGEDHPSTLVALTNLAEVYESQGRSTEAEPILSKLVDTSRRTLGEDHAATLSRMTYLAELYRTEGQYARAEPIFEQVLQGRRRAFGEENSNTRTAMYTLGLLYLDEGKYAQAESLVARILEVRRRDAGADAPATLHALASMGLIRLQQGDYAAAESLLREAAGGYEKRMPNNWMRFACHSMLGAILAGQKKYQEAEPLLLSGYEGVLQRKADIPRGNLALERTIGWLVQLYQDWGKPEKAVEWRRRLDGISAEGKGKE